MFVNISYKLKLMI